MAGNPHYAKVALQLPCSGANGSTILLDESPRPKEVTAVGATISTARGGSGGSSLLFSGSGQYVSVPNSPEYIFRLGDFTLECRAYFTDSADNRALFSMLNNYTFYKASNGTLYLFNGSGNSVAGNISLNAWHHVAYSRRNGIGYLGIDGGIAQAAADTIDITSDTMFIGRNTLNSAFMLGNMDDIRIHAGVGLYVDTYTVPDSPLGTYVGRFTARTRNSLGAYVPMKCRAHRESTGELVMEAMSDSGGNMTLYTPHVEPHTITVYPSTAEVYSRQAKVYNNVMPQLP